MEKAQESPKGVKRGSNSGGSLDQALRPHRFAFTIDADTGEIVQVESVDASGARHELLDEERSSLAKNNKRAGLKELLEQAFEAGIACVLGGEREHEREPEKETRQDVELRQILLKPLIEESPAARLMRPEVLDVAIVETLIHHSLKSVSNRPKSQGVDKTPTAPKAS